MSTMGKVIKKKAQDTFIKNPSIDIDRYSGIVIKDIFKIRGIPRGQCIKTKPSARDYKPKCFHT